MLILHVITGLEQGGAQECLMRLIRADSGNKHVVVSLLDEGVHGLNLRKHGIELYTLRLMRFGIPFWGTIQLFKIMLLVNPDIVQTWMCHADLIGGLAARLAGVPTVIWGIRNTLLGHSRTPVITSIVIRLCALLSRIIPTKITSCSAIALKQCSDLGYDEKRMLVIHNGVDLQRFRIDQVGRARVRTEWGVASGEILFGMVARNDPQKDHNNLLESLRILNSEVHPNWRCVLVGFGLDNEKTGLTNAIKIKGLEARIILAGPRDDIPDVMNAIDCHVLSSAYGEGFPNAVAEAMACETPCIATCVGESEMIIDKSGWVVPPSDSLALARALALVITEFGSPGWLHRKVLSRERIESYFHLENMVKSFQGLWKSEKLLTDKIKV